MSSSSPIFSSMSGPVPFYSSSSVSFNSLTSTKGNGKVDDLAQDVLTTSKTPFPSDGPLKNSVTFTDKSLNDHKSSTPSAVLGLKRRWEKMAPPPLEDELSALFSRVSVTGLRQLKNEIPAGTSYSEYVNSAIRACTNKKKLVRCEGLEIFITLVNKGQAYKEATIHAVKGLKDKKSIVHCKALKLIKALVNKEQAYKEATAAALLVLQKKEWELRCDALEILEKLVNKGEALKEALIAAKECSQSKVWVLRCNALTLFQALVKKGKAYHEAISAAEVNLGKKSDSAKREAVKLFLILFERLPGTEHFFLLCDTIKIACETSDPKRSDPLLDSLRKSVDIAKK